MKLIGNKEEFGIEFEIVDKYKSMGYAKIWLGNNFLGTSEDLIYLKSYLFNGLKEIISSPKIEPNFVSSNNCKQFEGLLRGLDNEDFSSEKYLVNFGTFTDDFIVFSFLDKENEINILWKLINQEPIFNDLKKSNKEICFYKIKKDIFEKDCSKFEELVMGSAVV
jgi:hypothetical protein